MPIFILSILSADVLFPDFNNKNTRFPYRKNLQTAQRRFISTASRLPSHIRSVEVKHSSHLADLSSLHSSSRTINIILILVFVFVTSLTVSTAVYKITEITDPGRRLQKFEVFVLFYQITIGRAMYRMRV